MIRRSENDLAFIALLSLSAGCGEHPPVADEGQPRKDTIAVEEQVFYVRSTYQGPYMLDSTELLRLDTATAAGKRRWRIHQFCWDHSPSGPLCDTLMDLNYDGDPDHVIGGYGSAGTGIKYFWEVYAWDKSKGRYVEDTTISPLPNPTFYPDDSAITSFYIGSGGGYGRELHWIEDRWQETKSFDVDNERDSTLWLVDYAMTGRRDTLRLPFQQVPPGELLKYHTE